MVKSSPKLKPLHSKQRNHIMSSQFPFYSPKLSIFLLVTSATLFTLYQIQSLHTLPSSPSPSWSLIHQQWQRLMISHSTTSTATTQELIKPMAEKLQNSVTFLPLKDLRYADQALQGHTWFMSSMDDTHQEGEVQYQQFPSQSSKGRLLCLKGNETHDGSWNYYAVAWPETLPINATLMKGLTFVSYNHYSYDNIWHGLSSIVPFVAWHIRNNCELPNRWVLYHWGELRFKMGPWLRTLTEATFGSEPEIERFDNRSDIDEAICFEKAVVMRHNEGGMSRERRMETYDLMRRKAREYCKVEQRKAGIIGMTLFMRTGPRSFKNESAVIGTFEKECAKIDGCTLMVAYSNNLTFCEQVKLMSMTDILISPHGAQLTNMFLMDRNSSVMEFFPKGWLRLAGVGQYVYHWIASWSGMRHQGAWRDPEGDACPYPEDDPRCMSIFKNGRIGFNQSYFSEWATNVLNEVKTRKLNEASNKAVASTSSIAN